MARTKNPNSERIFEDGKYFNKEKYEQGIKIVEAISPYEFSRTKVSNLKPTNYEALRHIKGL